MRGAGDAGGGDGWHADHAEETLVRHDWPGVLEAVVAARRFANKDAQSDSGDDEGHVQDAFAAFEATYVWKELPGAKTLQYAEDSGLEVQRGPPATARIPPKWSLCVVAERGHPDGGGGVELKEVEVPQELKGPVEVRVSKVLKEDRVLKVRREVRVDKVHKDHKGDKGLKELLVLRVVKALKEVKVLKVL